MQIEMNMAVTGRHSTELVFILGFALLGVQALDPGSFWHITDFHYDFSYPEDGYSCNKPVPLGERGLFGNGWCDPPWSLVNNSVHAMRAIQPDVDFIIWTGDTVLHTKNEKEHLNTSINVGILNNITYLLAEVFHDTITYPCYGNHDYFPDAQFPVGENDIYREMVKSWDIWLNKSSEVETMTSGGYYTTLTKFGKIRLVALNTNLYYTSNKLVGNITDPSGQLAWLDSVLTNASANQEKVVLIGHVPPGVFTPDGFLWFYEDHNNRFNDVIKRHTDVIAALHFGHDHMDEFKIFYKGETPAVPVFLAPSVTPWRYVSKAKTGRARNPGIRLVKYDRDTGRHLDYVQYYLDLDKANRQGNASWAVLYEAKAAYNIPDLTGPSMAKVRGRMLARESSPTQAYFTRMGLDADVETQCDRGCRDAIYCGMRHFDMVGYRECLGRLGSAGITRFSPVLLYLLVALSCLWHI